MHFSESFIEILFFMEKIKFFILFIGGVLMISLLLSYGSQNEVNAAAPSVRVALIKDAFQVDLSIRGKYTIINPSNQDIISDGRYLKRSKVFIQKNAIVLGDISTKIKRIRIIPQKDVSLVIKGEEKSYRDTIDIVIDKNKKLLVINIINLEKYVKGVLYHEVSHRWPLEALKAQAVATRTYALYQIKVNRKSDYDVTSDIYSQVYGGRDAERYRTNLAVNRTKGEVMYYNGEVLPAYFHANCGGHTENVKELWKQDLKPLSGVVCPYCKGQPGYSWKKNFQSKKVQDLLNQNGYQLGLIKEIKIIERTASGRVKNLEIVERDGTSVIISGKKFRDIIGPNNLKSNLYDIEMKGFYFDVTGKGWGHGVGMCQWGAYKMSRERFSYSEILNFYYPGVTIMHSKIFQNK